MWRLLLGTMGVKSLVQGLNAAATAGFERNLRLQIPFEVSVGVDCEFSWVCTNLKPRPSSPPDLLVRPPSHSVITELIRHCEQLTSPRHKLTAALPRRFAEVVPWTLGPTDTKELMTRDGTPWTDLVTKTARHLHVHTLWRVCDIRMHFNVALTWL